MSQPTELVVALDVSDAPTAEKHLEELKDLPISFKVGLELFTSVGPDWVLAQTQKGFRIFLDLKLYDIPNTVARTVLSLSRLNVQDLTLHLSGGKKMWDLVEEELRKARETGKIERRPRLYGVSILTSFSSEEWIANSTNIAKISGIRPIEEAVLHFAQFASTHPAVGGLVCSPHEIKILKEKHPELRLVVPGIRPTGSWLDDQERVMTPREAKDLGADVLVIGRPILRAVEPRKAAEEILKEIQ